ncbi:hypothetical protein [Fluviicola taffensis]|uniref:Outer membrane protein beta-barrel domain-containing protein n=1 Tax=Fluviicola taffensis (strain DSM 16823 / NCIMB 13979 / RW262) TaxID=755732 RepID=F2IH47_FLUTR|nr:hypothetical protein [Fluviicola taffensis]AEA45861.1 hypothetical protein Fluta_3897 [Fluviicola taffensis DSM 16823]
MKTHIVCLFLLITGINFAQQKDSLQSNIPAYIIKTSIGGIGLNKIAFTDAEWERMTPGFQVPDSFQVNTDGVDQFDSAADDFYSIVSFSFINNKEKRAGKKFQTKTTIHLGGGPEAKVSKYWFHENRTVIDTLFSNQTGNPYYVYGNKRQDIQKYYKIKSFMIGVGERFTLRPDRIFQFETGLDIFFLIGSSSEVKSAVTETYVIQGVNESNYTSPISAPSLNSPQISEYSAKMAKGLLICVPLDISFALSKKNAVLKRMRLGFEMNYGIALQFTKGKTSYNESRSWGLNFRYEFSDIRKPFR